MSVSIDQIVNDPSLQAGAIAASDTSLTLSGTATAGSTVTISALDGAELGATIANEQDVWSLTLPSQAAGDHTFLASSDAGGTDSVSVTIDATPAADGTDGVLTIDTTLEAVPMIITAAGDPSTVAITATSEAIGTNLVTPIALLAAAMAPVIASVSDDVGLLQGAISNGQSIDDTTPTLHGSGETFGDTIIVYDNGQLLGSTAVKTDGSWIFTPISTLLEGDHGLTVSSADALGNESVQSAAFHVVVDTVAPDAPSLTATDDVGSVVGAIAANSTTDDAMPTFGGAGEANGTVTVRDGAVVLGSTGVDANGNWSFTPATALAEGSHSITANETDAAGNVGLASSPLVFTVNTTTPTPIVCKDDHHDDNGCKVDTSCRTNDKDHSHDNYNGSNCNDTIKETWNCFGRIDGGKGYDTVQFSCKSTNIDLHNVIGCEKIDLGSKTHNTLNICLQDVLKGPDATCRTLTVVGDCNDTIKLVDNFTHGSRDTVCQNGINFDVWHCGSGPNAATLLLEHGMHVVHG
jgi:hypothetical protein